MAMIEEVVSLSVRDRCRELKVVECVPKRAPPIHLCRVYHLATMHRQMDRQTDDIIILPMAWWCSG